MATRETFGIFYGWWRGDALPEIVRPADLAIERLDDERSIPAIDALDPVDAANLLQQGHRLYVARIDGRVVGHGWAATQTAAIGELSVVMRLGPNERYLWGFATHLDWRGQGIYPALIQTILRREVADRFWIGHDAGNESSASGILRAGFVPVGEAYRGRDGALRYARYGDDERARAGQALLGMPS